MPNATSDEIAKMAKEMLKADQTTRVFANDNSSKLESDLDDQVNVFKKSIECLILVRGRG